jgi:hypothetical protein
VYPWNSSPGTGLGLSHPSSFSGARRAFGLYHPGVGMVNVGMGLRCQLQWPRRLGPRCEEAGPILTGWRPTGRSRGPILFPSQSARRRLGGTLFEKACLTRSEWGPTGQSRGHRQLLPQSDGGPRLRGRNHSLFRTLSQAGEAPGRVPGRSPTFTLFRTRALRASVAGRVPGSYGGSSAVASPCGWNPRLAGPGYPARKGEAHPSLVHTPTPDLWVANPYPFTRAPLHLAGRRRRVRGLPALGWPHSPPIFVPGPWGTDVLAGGP